MGVIKRGRKNEDTFFDKKVLTNAYPCGIILPVDGALAQLVARLNGIQKVRGSTPLCSTIKNETSDRMSYFLCHEGIGEENLARE